VFVRYFFTSRIPQFRRVVLVESGSRYLLEDLLPGVYSSHPGMERLDIVTCFPGTPAGFDPAKGEIHRVHLYRGREGQKRLFRLVRSTGYDICGIICSGEPLMTRWKWAIALAAPSKLLVLNENGDYFWADWSNRRIIRHFMLFRTGLAGDGAITLLGRLLVFPFALTYLLVFAAWVHLRRKVRTL
jgi:hypothetical protein